jgi:hypothetical protein
MMRSVAPTPPGWHPDPLGRHHLRYWDGDRWTEHVADSGVAGIDPLDAEPTPARTVHVDTHVRIGLRTRRLYVDDEGIWFGDDQYRFADVTGMTWWSTRVVAGPAYNINYHVKLWREGVDRKGRTIEFTGRAEELRVAYDKTVDALMRQVGPRRVDDVLRRVDAGEQVTLSQVVLSRAGMTLRKKHVEWSTRFRLEPYGQDGLPYMTVRADVGGKEKKMGEWSGLNPDAPLMPLLLELLVERYGQAPAPRPT